MMLLLVIVLVLLIAGGATYWFVLRDKSATTTNTSQNASKTLTDTEALAALKADSDTAGLTETSDLYTKTPQIYQYYDKDGASISMVPALVLKLSGYQDTAYSADVVKVEQLMKDNGLSLAHGDMAASTWKGDGDYVTYKGDTLSCSGRVGQVAGSLFCQTNTKLTSVYKDVQAAWATFPSTLVAPAVALDGSSYYESTDGTVKAVGVGYAAKHTDGTYYDEFAVKVGSADWKYISTGAPLSTGLDPSRPCSMLSKAEYKDVFRTFTDKSIGCVAGK